MFDREKLEQVLEEIIARWGGSPGWRWRLLWITLR